MPELSFFAELQKRKVVRAAAIYGAVAWGVTEVVVTVVQQLFLPQWVSTLAVIFFVVGFPIAMFLSWTFDLTADGIQRTTISSRRGTASIVLSLALLLTSTAALFFLIKPPLDGGTPMRGSVAIAPNSVAVLPFDYATSTSDDSHLGPILSDELRDQLGRVIDLRIAARSSSIAAAQEGADAKTTAQKLGVAHLLEGNMRRQGGVLRVSVQLIDGANGLAVWSNTFERGRRELLNLQQEIAEAVVREMLPGADTVVAEPATRVASANELMLLGRHYEQQVRERADVDATLLERSIQLYRDATEADPESALAYSRLAGALMYYGNIDSAEAPAYRALELNPRLAEAQNTWGKFLFVRGRPNMGEPLARAVELNPNLPDALNDYAFWRWMNLGEAGVEEFYRRALVLDPLNVTRHGALGSFLALNDDYSGARDVIERMRALFDSPESFRAIAEIYDLVGDVDHAIAWTIKARDVEPDNPAHVEKLAEYFVDIGDFEMAEALTSNLGVGLLFKMRRFDEMIEKAEELIFEFPEDVQLHFYLATAYSFSGRHDLAIRMIENLGILEHSANGRRGNEETYALLVLTDAAYAIGEHDEAKAIAERGIAAYYIGENTTWSVSVLLACNYAVIGNNDTEVYRRLQSARDAMHLAWDPMLKDLECFKRFANDPAYLAVLKHFDDRREFLRDRLPKTLAEYGVSLE